ncbi:APC family permease [Aeromicrobium sp.]|uniref:APC family permease n=1 Tax=Aeromicrobium sp. TaxID=1871063 RepID=UPI0028A929A0|nr:APC family permease [Aeromicrobium sp.]
MEDSSRAPAWPERSRFEGVARRRVRRSDLAAHSVAVLTPSLSALGTGLALPSIVGPGFWISTIAGYGLALVVAFVLGEFAQRFASGGSLYTFAAKGLGPTPALLVGVSLVLGYGVLVGAGISGAVSRSERAWSAFGGRQIEPTDGLMAVVLTALVCLAIIGAGIAWASRAAFAIEAVSITALLTVLGALVWRFGVPQVEALSLAGASPARIASGAALIATLTVAFESSAALGLEAGRPLRDVPRAMFGSLALTGVLFAAANAVGTVLPPSMAPYSFRWFAPGEQVSAPDGIVLLVLAASFLALAFCAWNAVARVIFSFAREGIAPMALGRTTHRGVPWLAVVVVLPVVLGPPVAVWLAGGAPTSVAWDLLRVATSILCVAYALTAVALIAFLARIDESRPVTTIAASVAVAGVLAVLLERLVATPAGAVSTLAWLLALGVAAVLWRLGIARRLARRRVVLGAHEVPLATDVWVPLGTGDGRDSH